MSAANVRCRPRLRLAVASTVASIGIAAALLACSLDSLSKAYGESHAAPDGSSGNVDASGDAPDQVADSVLIDSDFANGQYPGWLLEKFGTAEVTAMPDGGYLHFRSSSFSYIRLTQTFERQEHHDRLRVHLRIGTTMTPEQGWTVASLLLIAPADAANGAGFGLSSKSSDGYICEAPGSQNAIIQPLTSDFQDFDFDLTIAQRTNTFSCIGAAAKTASGELPFDSRVKVMIGIVSTQGTGETVVDIDEVRVTASVE